jgi:septum formation protein
MSLPPLILASASPRRAELLRCLGVDFRVEPGDIEEIQNEHLSPKELCQLNAYRKARATAKKFPDALVLGADTVVSLNHNVLGKPADRQKAHAMLRSLQGTTHEVLTGLCLLQLRRHQQRLRAVSTSVTFRRMSGAQIDDYLKKTQPLDKAGGYAIQDHGHLIIERMSGSFSNVVGLPLAELEEELNDFQEKGRALI